MSVHTLTFPNTSSPSYARTRYHFLLQVIYGETVAIDYCQRMASFAPNEETKNFLLKQQNEEDKHLEQLTEYASIHSRADMPISWYLRKLDEIMRDAIVDRDYVASVFIQNFIVEGLNISLLEELEHHGDAELSALCTSIIKDEVGHMQFGVDEVIRILRDDKDGTVTKRLISLQRRTLFYATGLAMVLGREAKNLGIPLNEFAEKTIQAHAKRVEDAQFPLPFIDRILFDVALLFLKVAGRF